MSACSWSWISAIWDVVASTLTMNESSGSITNCPELELELPDPVELDPVELDPVELAPVELEPVDEVPPLPVLAFPVPELPVPELPVPELPVELLEPLEEVPPVTVVLPAETVWPAERSVETTVPPTGAMRVASLRLSCA